MHPFASPLFRLAPLARLRAVRMLACVLAAAIAFSGFSAAAMPLHGAAPTQAGQSACAHHAPAPKVKHVHRADGCCGTACACAFVHALGPAAMPAAVYALADTSMPVPLREGVERQRASPPLRPPIA